MAQVLDEPRLRQRELFDLIQISRATAKYAIVTT